MTSKALRKYLFVLLISLISFNLEAQLKIKILKSPHSIILSEDSITIRVKFINTTDKDYLIFYTRTALPYKNPSDFYIDKLSPPTSIIVIANDQKIEAEPKFKFEYFQKEFLDFEAQKKFDKEQSDLWQLHDKLIRNRIKAAEANPLLIPSKSYKVVDYYVLTKDIELQPGDSKLKIGYCCQNIFRFEKTSINKFKTEFKNAEIFIGTVYSKDKHITIRK
jgi:hypothetical protein